MAIIILHMLRETLAYLCRGVVLKRNLPKDFRSRPIYVSPDAALGLWKRDLEKVDPFLFRFARNLVKPGNVVWDIGANVGLFTFAAAEKSQWRGHVLAVEPDPFLAGLLRRSALENCDMAKVHILQRAVSDTEGVVEFNISQSGRCANFVTGFGMSHSGGPRKSIAVPCNSLDGLLAEGWMRPDVVKIDIEGMDHIALRGASELLRLRPTLILEVSDANRDEIGETLRANDYKILDTDLNPVRKMPLCNVVAVAA